METTDERVYPDFIRRLPEIDNPLTGVRGWLEQGEASQTVFFDIQTVAHVPPHSHCAQWGFVVEGEMKLTIAGETRLVRKGDHYFIPEGAIHSAIFLTRVQVIDVFDDSKRYRARQR